MMLHEVSRLKPLRVKRESWGNACLNLDYTGKIFKESPVGKNAEELYSFDTKDVMADDWIVVKDMPDSNQLNIEIYDCLAHYFITDTEGTDSRLELYEDIMTCVYKFLESQA